MATATKARPKPKPEPEPGPQRIHSFCWLVGMPCLVAGGALWWTRRGLPDGELVGAYWWPLLAVGLASAWYLRLTRATGDVLDDDIEEETPPSPIRKSKGRNEVRKIEVLLEETEEGRLVRKIGGDDDTGEMKVSDLR